MGVIRFFDTDFAFKAFGGTFTASSGVPDNAFDQDFATYWQSTGEGTDGNAVFIERDFLTPRTLSRIFVRVSNISDITFEYWNGTIYVPLTILTTTDSADGFSHFYTFAAISTQKIRINGSNTIVPNEEKQIYDLYYFNEIGELQNPPDGIDPKYNKEQIKHKMDNGKFFIINTGSSWEIKLDFKAFPDQADISLIETLAQRQTEFFIWLNNGNETDFTYKFSPFKFSDLIKVSVDGDFDPKYHGNFFFSGVDFSLKMIEVV